MGSFGTKIIAILLVSTMALFAQATYYSQDDGNFSTTTNWDTQRDGTGSDPGSFDQGDIFYIQSGDTITMDNVSNFVQDLFIENGGTFDNSSNTIVFAVGSSGLDVQTGGTYTASTGTIEANAGVFGTVVLKSAAATSFNNITTSSPVTFDGAAFTINGTFKISTSRTIQTINSGSIAYGTSGTIDYNSSRTVGSEWPSAGVPYVKLSSGTVTIPSGTFEVDNKLTRVNGSVSLTGTLQFDSSNETTLEYAPSPAANVTVGGEWVTGSTTLPSNVTINNSGQTVTVSATARVIPKTLTLTAGTLAMGSNNLTILGSIASSDVAGSGAVTSSATISMDDGTTATTHYDQTISGAVTLANLTVNKAQANNDLTISGSPTITNDLIVTNGDVIANGTVTISSGKLQLDNASKFTVNSGALNVATLDLNGTSTFTTGGKSVTSLTTLTAENTTTFEFNGSSVETTPITAGATFGHVNMNNGAGLNINGSVTINGTLTFSTDGTVNVSGSNSLLLSNTGSISGNSSARFVNGPLQKAFNSGIQSFTYPVGYSSTYHPATFDYLSNDVATSIIEVKAVNGNPGGSAPSGISSIATSHHYVVSEQGTAGTFTYNFTGHYDGTGFSPETRNQLIRQTGSGPAYTYDNTASQTVNTTAKTVKINDALSALPTNDGKFAFGAGGAAVTWDGGGDGSTWSSAGNWSSDAVPSSADDVTIDVVAGVTVTIGSSTSAAAQSLTVGGGSGTAVTLVVSSTSSTPLTVTNAFTLNSEGVLTFSAANGDISAGSTSFNATSTVEYQSRTLPADTYGNLTVNGATGMSGSAGTVTVQGNLIKNGANFTAASGYPFVVTGTYLNSAGVATYSGGLTVNGTTYTVNGGSVLGNVVLSRSTGVQSIEGLGSEITFTNLTLNNSAGLTLNNPIRVNAALTLTSGLVTTTEANILTIGTGGSVANYDATHYINGPMASANTSNMFFPIGKAGDYRPVTLIYASGTTPTVRFEMFASDPAGTAGTGLNNISTIRYWKGQVLTGGFTGNIQLHWGSDDGVDGATTDLAVAQSTTGSSGSYFTIGNKNRSGDANSGWVQSTDGKSIRLSAADYFTFGSQTGDNSLPVELASFTATADYGKVTLDWATASELNNQGFNIYRRVQEDQDGWAMLNESMIDGQGNSSVETNYSFVDDNVNADQNYVYKLESVSLNGIRVDERIVNVYVPVPEDYALFNNYPNPFNPTTTIKFQLPETQQVSLIIYDATGRVVKELLRNADYSANEHTVTWNATDNNGTRVSSGIYFYRFMAGTFTKMGKMILLK